MSQFGKTDGPGSPSTTVLICQILYPIIVVTFGFVFVQAFRGKVPRRLAVSFAINLVAICATLDPDPRPHQCG